MPRHIACLTFDFDAMSGFVARGMTTPTPISRGEFGAVGARRLLKLLARRDLPSSWYVPGVVAESYPDIVREIADAGCELGNHGYTHEAPAQLSRQKEAEGLKRGSDVIEALTGSRPVGYRSPSWDLSPHTVSLLLEQGFLYDSSMMGHDCAPYYARTGDIADQEGPFRFGTETRLIEMPISWTLDDYPHFEWMRTATVVQQGLMHADSVMDNWFGEFDYMTRETDWGVLTFTCHPYVIGRGHRLLAFERFIARIRDHGAVFMRLGDAAREFDARGATNP